MYKRFICFFLVFTFIFSLFTFSACKRKQKPATKTIQEESINQLNLPHYCYNKIPIEYSDNIEDNFKYSLSQLITLNTNHFLALWIPLEENAPSYLKLYSLNESDIDVKDFSFTDNTFFATQILKISDSYVLYGENRTNKSKAIYKIDIENLTVSEDLTNSESFYSGITKKLNSTYMYHFPSHICTDDYLITNLSSSTNKHFIGITDNEGKSITKNIDELINLDTDDYSMSDSLFCLEHNTLLYFFHSINKSTSNIILKFYTFNIDTNNVEEYQLNADFKNKLSNILCKTNTANLTSFDKHFFFDNTNKHKAYIIDSSYIINEIDFKNQVITPILDLNDSYFNIADAEFIKNILVTDDDISLYVNGTNNYFCKFNKCDTNPNHEKETMTLASLSKIKPFISEAVANYNKNNDKYFIKYCNSYIFDKENFVESTDSYTNLSNNLTYTLNNTVREADIIIDGHNYSDLNNNFLIDLTPKMEELGNDYFQNIINASKTDEKLYNFPLTFNVPCIFIDNSKVDDLQTIDLYSYLTLINDQFNGDTLFSSNNTQTTELIIKQLLANINRNNIQFFNSNKFSTTIDFIKNLSNRNQHEEGLNETSGTTLLRNYLTYFNITKQSTFYPLPSFEKPEFVADITNSVAISSHSKKQDAAWEFIKILLNTANTQYDNFHINRSITRNNNILNFKNEMSFSQNKLQNESIDKIISTGENFINNINKTYQNYNILLFYIVYNEMNKYLSDLITFDEMIKTIEEQYVVAY